MEAYGRRYVKNSFSYLILNTYRFIFDIKIGYYMRHYLTHLNIVFTVVFVLVFLIAFGFLPREVSFVVLSIYIGYLLLAPLRSNVELFLRSIPFFIALPISADFDNLNIWRVVLMFVFIRWALEKNRWYYALISVFSRKGAREFIKNKRMEALGILFLILAGASIFVADDTGAALKRWIYLINAAFLFVVIRSLILEKPKNAERFMRSFALAGILAVVIGFIQFFSAYLVPPYNFHWWWGQIVSLNMYGQNWSDIVTDFGNTWFSYARNTLRLRMFSTFPDSHSFPMFVIMTFPAIIYIVFSKFSLYTQMLTISLKKAFFMAVRDRDAWLIDGGFALMNLALILTGTRGIWVSVILTFVVIGWLAWRGNTRRLAVLLSVIVAIYLMMFPIYFGIISTPQFQESGASTGAFSKRVSSIIDFGETSNAGRIAIWQKTLKSIADKPLLGVGVGNFPVVLAQPLSYMLAGSTAHNLFLHIAATIGIPGLIVFLAMLWEFARVSWRKIKEGPRMPLGLYFAVALFSLIWLMGYSLTDAALYDGRALLGFMAFMGITVGLYLQKQNNAKSAS